MRRTILLSFTAAAVGAVAALTLREGWESARIQAQQPLPSSPLGSRLFGQPPAKATPAAPGLQPTAPPSVVAEPLAAPDLALTDGTALDELTPEERTHVTVYEQCNRSVVNINTKIVTETLLFDIPSEGAGSGLVLDRAGHVLTNYHVVEDAKEIRVTLFDSKTYTAQLVGKDPQNDIAVLRIEAPQNVLLPVPFGDSTKLRVGQNVYAIGNPFGLERTLTIGIISSLNRTLPSRTGRTIKSIIQIDAAINPGNSGGPLLDSRGRFIGMNTAIASKTGQSAGVGFAIPAATVRRVVPQLIEKGHVTRPEVGITRVYQTERGLLIAGLMRGGPAERADLRGPRVIREQRRQGPFLVESQKVDVSSADLIVAVNGEKIKTADDFLSHIEMNAPGQVVTITVIREGREVDVQVQLGVSSEE
jgi:S1-C subfamily serine protease